MPLLAGLISLLVFLPGIGWGLPSRDADRFLFGDRTPWTGAEIIALAGGFDAGGGRGADVDANPLDRGAGDAPVVLNDTDAKRAEIVRRYRLQSHQPDEFINFAAVAGMAKAPRPRPAPLPVRRPVALPPRRPARPRPSSSATST